MSVASQGAAPEIGSNTIIFVQLRRERVFGSQGGDCYLENWFDG